MRVEGRGKADTARENMREGSCGLRDCFSFCHYRSECTFLSCDQCTDLLALLQLVTLSVSPSSVPTRAPRARLESSICSPTAVDSPFMTHRTGLFQASHVVLESGAGRGNVAFNYFATVSNVSAPGRIFITSSDVM